MSFVFLNFVAMRRRVCFILTVMVVASFSYAQDSSITTAPTVPTTPPAKKIFLMKTASTETFNMDGASIGLGTGVLSFYGDVRKRKIQTPLTGKIAFDIQISKYINPYLQLSFHSLYGKVGARSNYSKSASNLNFVSQIRTGGVSMLYNFNQFFPKEEMIRPYVSLGLESFEYSSKTDRYDKNGNLYHYWSDGSIRDKSEMDPAANSANVVTRDYKYETDVREANLDGFDKYKEQSFAIPVGAGVLMHVTDKFDLKIGTTIYYSFTDYIDGVTKNSVGERKGNGRRDKFVMTGFSLNFILPTTRPKVDTTKQLSDEELLALDRADQDKDGVLDTEDSCQATPAGIPVDKKGCPFDDDEDGVPNFLDKEQNTPKNAEVNSDGVQLSDSLLQKRYNAYMDSTGEYNKTEVRETHESAGTQRQYTIQLGIFQNGIPPEQMAKFLSLADVNSNFINDSTAVYTSGTYVNYNDAEARKKQLIDQGFGDAKIVYKDGSAFIDAPRPSDQELAGTPTNVLEEDTGKVTFRVQLGAYRRKISAESVFANIKDIVEVKEENGLYKYSTGSFSTMKEVAKFKIELLTKGYENTIIAAYKGGKRVTLRSVGATFYNKKTKENLTESTSPYSTVNKKNISFKVQVGVFKNEPPVEELDKFKKIEGLQQEKTTTGLTRYVAGNFNNYNAALALKNKIISKANVPGAFVVAKLNNEYISLQEALELIK